MSSLRLGVPSKGRMRESTIDWFKENGLQIKAAVKNREYSASVGNFKELEVVFLTAGEIPYELAMGRIDLGVTGQDLVHENLADWCRFLIELKTLDFGIADLVLAVPKFWVDVESVDDLDAVATSFRRKNGYRLRIATKYHNLVWSYLRNMGVADYQLVESKGATEGTIKNDNAEVIADISSSGNTLEANHLKVIGNQPILRSQAAFYCSREAEWGKTKATKLKELCSVLRLKPSLISDLIDSQA